MGVLSFNLPLALPLLWQCIAIGVVVMATAVLVFSSLCRRRLRRTFESNLRDQARLRTMLEQTPAILWTTDRELRFTSCDGAGLAALGSQPGAMVGTTLFDFFKTADRDFLPIARHLEALDGQSRTYEFTWEGQTWLVHCEPLRGADGQVAGTVGVALDITFRKSAEHQLARGQAKTRALLTAIPDVMFCLRRDGTVVEFIDKLLSPTQQEKIGRHVRDVFPVPGVAERFLDAAARALDTQQTQILEYTTGGAGDARRFFDARVVGCGNDEVLVIVRNVTERRAAEEDLRLRESQLRSLVRAIPDMIFQVTQDGRIAGCLAPSSDDLLMSPDQFLGRTITEVLPAPVALLLNKHLRAAVETKETQVVQYALDIQNQTRWFEARLVFAGDQSGLVMVVVRNITDVRTRSYIPAVAATGDYI
jgi:PAS domain S-box-containing protein